MVPLVSIRTLEGFFERPGISGTVREIGLFSNDKVQCLSECQLDLLRLHVIKACLQGSSHGRLMHVLMAIIQLYSEASILFTINEGIGIRR